MNTESKKTSDDAIFLKKKLFKILKEEQLFSKFYISCSAAFYNNPSPSGSLDCYIMNTIKYFFDADRVEEFVYGIKSWRKTDVYVIMP